MHKMCSNDFRKNVLIVLNAREIAGVEKRFGNWFEYISDNPDDRFAIHLLLNTALFNTKNNSYNHIKISETLKIRKFGIPTSIWGIPILNSLVTRFIDNIHLSLLILILKSQTSFDLIHLVNTSSLKQLRFLRKSQIITSFYNGGSTQSGIKNRLYKIALRRGVYFDCLSEDIKRLILEKGLPSADPNRIFLSPCSFINYDNTDNQLSDKENTISFVGRLNEDKGLRLLKDALIPTIARLPNYKFKILGTGPLEKELKDYIKGNRLEEHVKIFYSNDPKEILRKSKIFLSLQKRENYPSQSLIEAMACKNAVIATNVGLTSKLVNGKTGILIPRDSQHLVETIILLAENMEIIRNLGENARTFVLTNHTIERFSVYLTDIYLQLSELRDIR